MILMKLKFLFKTIFKNSSDILGKALAVKDKQLKMNVTETLDFNQNIDDNSRNINTSIFKSFCYLYEIYNKIKSLNIKDGVRKQAKKLKSTEMKENINNTMNNIVLSRYYRETSDKFDRRLSNFEVSKKAITELLNKKNI